VVAADAALCKFNGGRSGGEVCPDHAVGQGTHGCVGRGCWPGKINVVGRAREKAEGRICWEQDREMRSEPRHAKDSS